jgi:hypothetical protein
VIANRLGPIVILAMVAAGPGCSLSRHRPSPQQQFLGAMQRGNSAQASQLWLSMSAADRANFAHGIGFRPETSPADVQAELTRRQNAMTAGAGADSGGGFVDGGQTIEYPGIDSALESGRLQNLPNLQSRPGSGSPPTSDDAP